MKGARGEKKAEEGEPVLGEEMLGGEKAEEEEVNG